MGYNYYWCVNNRYCILGLTMPLRTYINILLPLAILTEAFSLLFLHKQHITSNTLNAIILFISSLATGVLVITKFYNTGTIQAADISDKKNGYVIPLTAIAAIVWMATDANSVLKRIAIDKHWSDIIPAIQIIVKRFVHGKYPYAPMTELGYTTPVGYMPFHWLPYSIAEFLKFDYRWISFSAFILAFTVLVVRTYKRNVPAAIITIILTTASYYLMSRYSTGMMAVTVELLIAAYYMLLVTGINSNKYMAIGATVAICLLSRYSFVLWLPLGIFVLYASGHKILLLKATITSVVIILLCYIIPFLSKDWTVFYKTNTGYAGMNWEWQHLCDNGLPCNLFNGVGFAHLYYNLYGQANYKAAFEICRLVFFIASIGVCILMGIWYWVNKKKIDYRIFLLASLKIYLSVFFACMIVPYDYLMITGLLISIALYAEQARYRVV